VSQELLDGYFNWNEILIKCDAYAKGNDFIESDYLPETSSQGLSIPYLKIADPKGLPDADRKAIFIVGGSDTEPIGPSMIFYIINRLIEDYNTEV